VNPDSKPLQDWPGSTEEHAVEWAQPANATAAIARAERAIADLAKSLGDAVGTQAEVIAQAFAKAQAEEFAPASVEALFAAAHDLKGQAATLGHPAVSEICHVICRLLQHPRDEIAATRELMAELVSALDTFARREPGSALTSLEARRLADLQTAINRPTQTD
jgi:chemotaxis protein histidine kinase CheA